MRPTWKTLTSGRLDAAILEAANETMPAKYAGRMKPRASVADDGTLSHVGVRIGWDDDNFHAIALNDDIVVVRWSYWGDEGPAVAWLVCLADEAHGLRGEARERAARYLAVVHAQFDWIQEDA